MMKFSLRRIAAAGLAALCMLSAASCASKSKPLYDFDLSEYVTVPAYKGVEVSLTKAGENVDSAINTLLTNKATSEDITDRPAEMGDTVNIDFTGTIDGELFDGGTGANYNLELGSGAFIDGFEEALVGHSAGEEQFLIHATFPEEYPANPDLAGKEAGFTVKINSIKRVTKPEFTDEFCAANTDYATVEEYRAAKLTDAKKTLAWESVVNGTVIKKYPDEYVKLYYNNMLAYYESYASAYGYSDVKSFLVNTFKTSIDNALAYLAEYAKSQCRQEMILLSIARAEGMTISDKDYKSRVDSYAAEIGYSDAKQAENTVGRETLELNMLMDDVGDMILANIVEVQ